MGQEEVRVRHGRFIKDPPISGPMAFTRDALSYPAPRAGVDDPRFLDLRTEDPGAADVLLAGVPYDASVLGRKGARKGPAAIREAFRFLGNHHVDAGTDLRSLRWHDLGDVDGLRDEDVLATHAAVRAALAPRFAEGKPLVLLGGDHGLTFPHVQALADATEGPIGIVVIDAHYDLRDHQGQPTSGTPFRRILEELEGGPVRGTNLVQVGIRPYANASALADYAGKAGIHVVSAGDVRRHGTQAVVEAALERAGDGTEHLWLSVDIDGLDQSLASGCSSPGAGGLHFPQAQAIVEAVAADPRCRGMDLMEVAPDLDPTGNTARTAAQLVAHFMGALHA